jgi:hypothetical protein
MNAETLSAIAGSLLSLVFSYIPGLHERFELLSSTHKRLVMLAMIGVVGASAFGLSCAGWGMDLGLDLVCDRGGLVGLVQAIILAAMANQATYLISPVKHCHRLPHDPIS